MYHCCVVVLLGSLTAFDSFIRMKHGVLYSTVVLYMTSELSVGMDPHLFIHRRKLHVHAILSAKRGVRNQCNCCVDYPFIVPLRPTSSHSSMTRC